MKPVIEIVMWILATPGLIVTNVLYILASILLAVHKLCCKLLTLAGGKISFNGDYDWDDAWDYVNRTGISDLLIRRFVAAIGYPEIEED